MAPFASPEHDLKASQVASPGGPSPPPFAGKKRKFARLPSLQLTHFVPLPDDVVDHSSYDQPTSRGGTYDENSTPPSPPPTNSLGLHNLHTHTFDMDDDDDDEQDGFASYGAPSYNMSQQHGRNFSALACLDANLPLHDASPSSSSAASSPKMSRQSSYSSFTSVSTFGSLSTARSISSMRSTATTVQLCDSTPDVSPTRSNSGSGSPFHFSNWSFPAPTSTSLTPELANFTLPKSPLSTFASGAASPLSSKSPLTTRLSVLAPHEGDSSADDDDSDTSETEEEVKAAALLFDEPSFKRHRTRSDTVSTATSVSTVASASTAASSVPEVDMSPCTAPLVLPNTSASGHSYSVKDREPLLVLHRQLKHWMEHATEPLTTARLSKIGVKASPGTSSAILRRAAAPGSIIVTRPDEQGALSTWYDGVHRDANAPLNAPKLTVHRFLLPRNVDETLAQGGRTSELVPVACIRWNGECYVTVCDVIRILTFRLHVLGYRIANTTKLSEGVYSDLRTCRPGSDYVQLDAGEAVLLAAASVGATQSTKAQRIFRWGSFDHDRLLINALQRDVDRTLRREERVILPRSEPATLFRPERSDSSLAQRFGLKGSAPSVSGGRSASAAMLQALALGWHANYARGRLAPQHATLKLASEPDARVGFLKRQSKEEAEEEEPSSHKLRPTRSAAVAAAKALRR